MSDYEELKRLAEAHAKKDIEDPIESKRVMMVEPTTVLALIAEIEALKGPHDWLAEDLIKELVDNAQSFQENACEEGEDPFVVVLLAAASRIRRQEVNIDQLKAENEALREEVALDDKIIAGRDRLLNMFECPEHGQCVPYAMEQVEQLRASKLYWVAAPGSGLVRCVTDARYRKFSPSIRARYSPVVSSGDAP